MDFPTCDRLADPEEHSITLEQFLRCHAASQPTPRENVAKMKEKGAGRHQVCVRI